MPHASWFLLLNIVYMDTYSLRKFTLIVPFMPHASWFLLLNIVYMDTYSLRHSFTTTTFYHAIVLLSMVSFLLSSFGMAACIDCFSRRYRPCTAADIVVSASKVDDSTIATACLIGFCVPTFEHTLVPLSAYIGTRRFYCSRLLLDSTIATRFET